ncbi:MAG: HEAT repeat domain-containing protein [Planctomycetales bacterium]|nr:HEAT repeat domain-containing protein [Planctomycetales bacterium]
MFESSFVANACSWLQASVSNSHVTDDPLATLEYASAEEIEALLQAICEDMPRTEISTQRLRLLTQMISVRLRTLLAAAQHELALIAPSVIEACYVAAHSRDSRAAAHSLQLLSLQGDEESIATLADNLNALPLENWESVGLALSPLWNTGGEVLEFFFERLGEETWHPASLAVLLDLANYGIRSGKLRQHPWQQRARQLDKLLGSAVGQLRLLESDPRKFGDNVSTIQKSLQDSVALVVALCDALGQLKFMGARSGLIEALTLSHRRIQIEAASALARMGDDSGKRRLIELAGDVAARQRAVAYADELGFVDEIDEQLRLPHALAESELASWLAEPSQFGIAPARLELLDTRVQFWPSYEEPRCCYLFRYWYDFPGGELHNIGIVGPVCHAFQSDMTQFSYDDIYAAFAGWHAEHEEIFEVPSTLLNAAQRKEAELLGLRLREHGFEQVEFLALTFMLGEPALLCRASRGDTAHSAVVDQNQVVFFPTNEGPSSIPPELVLSIYRGRKMLESFNRHAE